MFDAVKLMAEKSVGALVVTQGGKIVGIISVGDLVKAILSEQRLIIEQLEHYIEGDL